MFGLVKIKVSDIDICKSDLFRQQLARSRSIGPFDPRNISHYVRQNVFSFSPGFAGLLRSGKRLRFHARSFPSPLETIVQARIVSGGRIVAQFIVCQWDGTGQQNLIFIVTGAFCHVCRYTTDRQPPALSRTRLNYDYDGLHRHRCRFAYDLLTIKTHINRNRHCGSFRFSILHMHTHTH